jgi:hypothetical protein
MAESTTNLSLTLDPKDVQRIITETIRTQVATALAANGKDLVGSIVTGALQERRDSYGHRSEREPTVLEKLLRVEVEAATKDAIKAWVTTNKVTFVKAVDNALRTKAKDIAGALVDSLVKAVDDNYLRVGITLATKERS